ncbi:MAG: GTP cyclohydrolase II [Cellvibrionales bacterium]|nr:GTP cyclohydrolase II [Cellvibrionales bacterium]
MYFIRSSKEYDIDYLDHKWHLSAVEFYDRCTRRVNTVLCYRHGVISNSSYMRINSPCITSELFNDFNRCDCKDQFDVSIDMIQKNGSGFILYNQEEEGRGSGILDKIDSYYLMDKDNISTKKAFECLGLNTDSRNYSYVKYFAEHFNFTTIRLLTNNNDKIQSICDMGINCTRTPVVSSNPKIGQYIKSKAKELGHLFDKELLNTY